MLKKNRHTHREASLAFRVAVLRLALLSVLSCSFVACSNTKSPEPIIERQSGGFQVQVTKDGKSVENYQQSLVHRVTLSKATLQKMQQRQGAAVLPFTLLTVNDRLGKVKGLKVKTETPGARASVSSLGLREGDLVTAVGRKPVEQDIDFVHLFDELSQAKQSSITLERGGNPHKIFYFIN